MGFKLNRIQLRPTVSFCRLTGSLCQRRHGDNELRRIDGFGEVHLKPAL